MIKEQGKADKAAAAAAATSGSESKEQSDTESAPPSKPISRKPSATILETLVADNKEAAASIAQASATGTAAPSTAHSPALMPVPAPPTGDFSSISSTNLPAALAPLAVRRETSPSDRLWSMRSLPRSSTCNLFICPTLPSNLAFSASMRAARRCPVELRDLDGLADVMQSLSQLIILGHRRTAAHCCVRRAHPVGYVLAIHHTAVVHTSCSLRPSRTSSKP